MAINVEFVRNFNSVNGKGEPVQDCLMEYVSASPNTKGIRQTITEYKNGVPVSTTTYTDWGNAYREYMGAYIPKSTVTVTTPIDLEEMHNSTPTRDGLMGMCEGCKKLTSFDLDTDTTGVATSNFYPYVFAMCESLKTVNVGTWFSSYDHSTPVGYGPIPSDGAEGNNSLYCFFGCDNLETITGTFNFASSPEDPTDWTGLMDSALSMFGGCSKLKNVQIHLTGDQTSFLNGEIYKWLGLDRSQFVLV